MINSKTTIHSIMTVFSDGLYLNCHTLFLLTYNNFTYLDRFRHLKLVLNCNNCP